MLRTILCLIAALFIFATAPTSNANEVKRVSVNGTELSYVEVGRGEPVIFVHGGLQDYRMWGAPAQIFRSLSRNRLQPSQQLSKRSEPRWNAGWSR